MAAPMVTFCSRFSRAAITKKCSLCRILTLPENSQSIYTDAVKCGKSPMRDARRLKVFLSKKKSFEFEAADQLKLVKPPSPALNPSTKSRQVPPHQSIRLRTYNTIVYDHLRDIINSDIISKELMDLQVELVAVRYTGDMSTCRVFWKPTGTSEENERIQTTLNRLAPKIRGYLISLRLLGKIPQLCFLTDKGAANAAEVQRLLAIADFGPEKPDVPNEESELDRSQNDQQIPSDPSTQDKIFGIDHGDIYRQIQMHKEQGGEHTNEGIDKKKDRKSDVAKNFQEFYKDIKKQKKVKKSKSAMRREATMYRGEMDDVDETFDRVDQGVFSEDNNDTEYEDDFHDYEEDSLASHMESNEIDDFRRSN